jgi:hypothetical protein
MNKHHSVAISHVARKLVGIIYAVCPRPILRPLKNMRSAHLTPYSLSSELNLLDNLEVLEARASATSMVSAIEMQHAN